MKTRQILPLFVLLALFFSQSLTAQANESNNLLVIDRFDHDLTQWETQSFQGETLYRVVADEDGNAVLQADSDSSASGLIKKIEFDPNDWPRLRWRWKVSSTLAKGDARTKEGDDYAARVYVVFPHWIKPLTKTINYIWANRLPQGEAVPNSYYARAMMVAVESGAEKAGVWISEERNIVEDFRRLFGEDPPSVGAIAIMSDTDNTKGKVRAWYDDLIFLPPADPQ